MCHEDFSIELAHKNNAALDSPQMMEEEAAQIMGQKHLRGHIHSPRSSFHTSSKSKDAIEPMIADISI